MMACSPNAGKQASPEPGTTERGQSSPQSHRNSRKKVRKSSRLCEAFRRRFARLEVDAKLKRQTEASTDVDPVVLLVLFACPPKPPHNRPRVHLFRTARRQQPLRCPPAGNAQKPEPDATAHGRRFRDRPHLHQRR